MYDINTVSNIYVSNKYGDDRMNFGFYPDNRSDGLGPVKTIERALEIVRDMRMLGYFQPVSVKLVDSEYFIEKPVFIKNDVSLVTIEPYSSCTLYGGKRITGFKNDVYNGKKCISADVSEIIDSGQWFTDFYVNGKRAKLTRYPKEDTLLPAEVENDSEELSASSKWFIARKEDMKKIMSFKNLSDCLISYNHFWIDEHTPIESYDCESGKIVLKYKSRFTISEKNPSAKMCYYFENVSESFDSPGEWYLDRTNKKVYYIPADETESAENTEAFIPVTQKIFVIEGNEEKPVKNITIRNLVLAYTKGDYKSRYFFDVVTHIYGEDEVGFSSDPQSLCFAHGSVEFKYAKNCSFEMCGLKCFGLHGIVIYEGCSNIRIEKNVIANGGAGGISVSGGEAGSEEKYHTCYISITDNIIKNCGERYFAACGILIRHAYNNRIAHNTVSELYYSGISVGWVWGYKESICHDNIIEFNHIYNIGKGKLSDMGGIYLLGKQKGTLVRNNLIHGVTSRYYGGWGIYTDEGSSYITVENNICYDFSENAFHHHYGDHNVVKNNIFISEKSEAVKVSQNMINTGVLFENNIMITADKPIYKLYYDYGKELAHFSNVVSSNNILYSTNAKEPTVVITDEGKLNIKEVNEKFNFEKGSISADPLFIDIKKPYAGLKNDSPVFEKGFKNIDIESVGAR